MASTTVVWPRGVEQYHGAPVAAGGDRLTHPRPQAAIAAQGFELLAIGGSPGQTAPGGADQQNGWERRGIRGGHWWPRWCRSAPPGSVRRGSARQQRPAPAGPRPTRSEKVPPRAIQNCQPIRLSGSSRNDEEPVVGSVPWCSRRLTGPTGYPDP